MKREYFKSIDKEFRYLGNIFKLGNKKIGNNTIIFNMSPVKQCISKKLGLCQLKNPNTCYALSPELMYKYVLEYRKNQKYYWNKANKEIILNDIIHIKQVRPFIKYIRFNESGDIRDLKDIQVLNYLANNLIPYGVIVYTYTARRDIFKDNNIVLSSNLVINGSGFMIHNNYMISDNIPTNSLTCISDCTKCNLCKTRLNRTIYVRP